MYSKILLFGLIFVLLFTSCKESSINSIPKNDTKTPEDSLSPALTIASGPNLNPDWNWLPGRDDPNVHLYTRTEGDFMAPLPYYSAQFSGISSIGTQDVKKNNGWRLYYRNFGTANNPARNPIFVLYNIYTATFRVFVYSAVHHENFSKAFAEVSRISIGTAGSGDGKPALFTFKSGSLLKDSNNKSNTVAAINFTNDGWFYFDFNTIGYQPNISYGKFANAALGFKVRGINTQSLKLSGNFNANAIYSGGSSNLFSTTGNLLSNLNGSSVTKFFGNFSEDGYLRKKKNEALDNGNQSLADKFLNLLDSPFTDFIPGISGLTGFIGGLFGGNTAPVLTGFDGNLTLQGTANTKKDGLNPHSVRIYGAQETNSRGVGEPLYKHQIGIFNLQSSGMHVVDAQQGRCVRPPRYGGHKVCAESFIISPVASTNIQINPTLESKNDLTITKEISSSSNPSGYYSLNELNNVTSRVFDCIANGAGDFFAPCPDSTSINVKVTIKKSGDPTFKPKFFIQSYNVPINYDTRQR